MDRLTEIVILSVIHIFVMMMAILVPVVFVVTLPVVVFALVVVVAARASARARARGHQNVLLDRETPHRSERRRVHLLEKAAPRAEHIGRGDGIPIRDRKQVLRDRRTRVSAL